MTPRLADATLGRVVGARVPGYDRSALTPAIVHVGLGAFARAHVAVYCDDLVAGGDDRAAVAGVSLRSTTTADALCPQDGLFAVVTTDGTTVDVRVIGSVADLVVGSEAAAAAIAAPTTRVVTLTVTEKGYRTGPMAEAVVEGLRRRSEAGLGGLAVVSCDNLPSNGAATRVAVRSRAESVGDELVAWIDDEVAFPSTVVDRIVPATTDADRELVVHRLGVTDAWPVRAEPYRQWVIETTPGLPAWETVGATVVDDVAPWEARKLRLVNGPHSALAYLGVLTGIDTIAETIADPVFAGFVAALAEHEVAPTVPATGADPVVYAATARERFANAALGHRTLQVAMDGSQKLPPRVLAPIGERLAAGVSIDRLALVVAAWMIHVAACIRSDVTLDDPLAPVLADRVRAAAEGSAGLVDALLGVREVFGAELAARPELRAAVLRAVRRIDEVGARSAAAMLT